MSYDDKEKARQLQQQRQPSQQQQVAHMTYAPYSIAPSAVSYQPVADNMSTYPNESSHYKRKLNKINGMKGYSWSMKVFKY